jgi:hypothetical protein
VTRWSRLTVFRERRAISADCSVSGGAILTTIVRKFLDDGMLHSEYQAHSSGSSIRIFRKTPAMPHTGGTISSLRSLEFDIQNDGTSRFVEVSASISDALETTALALFVVFLIWLSSGFALVVLPIFVATFLPVAHAKYQFAAVMRLVESVTDSNSMARKLSSQPTP